MTERLAGRICIVTGAANGIGRASALCLARAGADIAILDREAGPLAEVADEIGGTGRRVLPLTLDCTVQSEIEPAFGRIHSEWGRVDVLFNNVGQSAREQASEFWSSDPETWRFVLNVSLVSAMLCTRQVVNGM